MKSSRGYLIVALVSGCTTVRGGDVRTHTCEHRSRATQYAGRRRRSGGRRRWSLQARTEPVRRRLRQCRSNMPEQPPVGHGQGVLGAKRNLQRRPVHDPPKLPRLAGGLRPAGNTSCCAVEQGAWGHILPWIRCPYFHRQGHPATVTDFKLDVYEVTVGRFRRFVDAGRGTQAEPPQHGLVRIRICREADGRASGTLNWSPTTPELSLQH